VKLVAVLGCTAIALPRLAIADPSTPPDADSLGVAAHTADESAASDGPDEAWTVHGQETTIAQRKDAFAAAYTNLNGTGRSLVASAEGSYTQTITAVAAVRAWHGGELYIAPEMAGSIALSNLCGLGGSIQNGELQKSGSVYPAPYLSRVFLRETIELGGERTHLDAGALQLATTTRSRRLAITAGNVAALDIFDHNSYAGDVRRQFINMAFMTHAAYDVAGDARGYTWGAAAELYWDNWEVRVGRFAAPAQPNQLPLDFDLIHSYADQIELGRKFQIGPYPGEVRLLGFRDRENMGRFADAIAAFEADPNHNAAMCTGFTYGSQDAQAPDLCWVRRSNVKVGAGINVEQSLGRGIGVFGRAAINDGQTEFVTYLAADRSAAGGVLATGELWGRGRDLAGIGFASAWVSSIHARYLALGGIDGFVGDGALRAAPEQAFEALYSLAATRWLSVSADFQHIWNPGFNADRSGVTIFGGRIHAEL